MIKKRHTQVHISTIKAGDTVLHNGHEKTVCRNNLTRDSFMGQCLFGDSYRLGRKPVTKVIYEKQIPTVQCDNS